MANKKNDVSENKTRLYNELKKLAKRANQRIVRLERLTGLTETFATKQLYDYLDTEQLNALTSKGRVAVRKSFDKTQMEAIIKATNDFLNDVSTVSKVRKLQKDYEKETGVKLDFAQVNTLYATQSYRDIVKKYFDSGFWNVARVVVSKGQSYNRFVDVILTLVEEDYVDSLLKEDLQGLYNYIQDVKV